jgi:GT2 family glycosyltransferase
MDYVVGASMFVPMHFLQEVGLLDESFFLYYEELDWATRGKGRFPLAYAPKSIVYHKIGGTIGTSSNPARKSLISDFYTLRNRLHFTSRRYPYALPTVYAGMLAALAVRLVFGQWRKARMVCRLLANPRRTFKQCVASR